MLRVVMNFEQLPFLSDWINNRPINPYDFERERWTSCELIENICMIFSSPNLVNRKICINFQLICYSWFKSEFQKSFEVPRSILFMPTVNALYFFYGSVQFLPSCGWTNCLERQHTVFFSILNIITSAAIISKWASLNSNSNWKGNVLFNYLIMNLVSTLSFRAFCQCQPAHWLSIRPTYLHTSVQWISFLIIHAYK